MVSEKTNIPIKKKNKFIVLMRWNMWLKMKSNGKWKTKEEYQNIILSEVVKSGTKATFREGGGGK